MIQEIELTRHRLKQELDDLRVQAALGKAEAGDYLEKRKHKFVDFLHDIERELTTGEEVTALHEKIDELRVKLALGKMETRDQFKEQHKKITHAIGEARHQIQQFESGSGERMEAIKDKFEYRAHAFMTELEVFELRLEGYTIFAAEEIGFALEKVSDKIHQSARITENEAVEAWKHLRAQIKKIHQ